MDLKTALTRAGSTAGREDFLARLREKAPTGELRGSLSGVVKDLVPAATDHYINVIVKALKAEELVNNTTGQGSSPVWQLALSELPPVEKLPEVLAEDSSETLTSLSERLAASQSALRSKAEEAAAWLQAQEDAVGVAELLEDDVRRIELVIVVLQQSLSQR